MLSFELSGASNVTRTVDSSSSSPRVLKVTLESSCLPDLIHERCCGYLHMFCDTRSPQLALLNLKRLCLTKSYLTKSYLEEPGWLFENCLVE